MFNAIAVFSAVDFYAIFGPVNANRSWWYYFYWSLPTAYSWALLAPIILYYSRRWSLEEGQRGKTILRHLALLAILAPLQGGFDVGMTMAVLVAVDATSFQELVKAIPFALLSGLARAPVVYAVIAGFGATMALYERYLDGIAARARLKDSLVKTRLQALGTMLNPHFLFNTLNAIGPLSRKDSESTNRMVALLGGLLHRSLEGARRPMVTLREEMEFIQDYLQVVRIRSAAPLGVECGIRNEALEVLVPNMILQPIVENAIRHGLAHHPGPGRLIFRAWVRGGMLWLEVEDNGIGLDKKSDGAVGVGLALTRERLEGFYGKRGSLELANRPSGGARVTLKFPVQAVLEKCEEK